MSKSKPVPTPMLREPEVTMKVVANGYILTMDGIVREDGEYIPSQNFIAHNLSDVGIILHAWKRNSWLPVVTDSTLPLNHPVEEVSSEDDKEGRLTTY